MLEVAGRIGYVPPVGTKYSSTQTFELSTPDSLCSLFAEYCGSRFL